MSIKINKKSLFKIIISLLAVVVGLFVLLFLGLQLLVPTGYRNTKDYKLCLDSVFYKSDIEHFPKTIPNSADEVKLYCIPGTYEFDGALVLLKFKIDKAYIEKELRQHQFVNSNTRVGTVQKIYNMPSKFVGMDNTKLTYFVINNKENYNENEEYFPYFTGIGVDKNFEYILYYYIKPD